MNQNKKTYPTIRLCMAQYDNKNRLVRIKVKFSDGRYKSYKPCEMPERVKHWLKHNKLMGEK